MTTPNIETIRQIAENFTINNSGKKLSEKFLDELFSVRINSTSAIKNDKVSRYNLIEITGLVSREGEENTINIIKDNEKNSSSLYEILRKSDTFIKERKRFFIDTTYNLREKKKIASILKCPKCKSDQIETKTVQMRAGDESSTDQNLCRKCDYKFNIT